MKIDQSNYIEIRCNTEKERKDCIALLELLDFKPCKHNKDYGFKIQNNIFLYVDTLEYQLCNSYSKILEWITTAEDFIRDNF